MKIQILHLIVVMTTVLFSTLSGASNHEFSNFKTSSKFNALTSEVQNSNFSVTSELADMELSHLLSPKKLKNNNLNTYNSMDLSKIPWDRILKIILPFLLKDGENKTLGPLNELINWEKKFGGKIKNFGTIEWQEPLGYISVYARRELDEVATGKIEVNDVLELTINAETFLKHLSNEKLIEISNDQLSAFANVKYHKIFNYKHYKKTLEEAKKADFSTLLFPFKFFHFPDMLKLKKDEELSHQDFLSLNVEASASVTFYGFIKAGVTVSGTLEHQQATMIKIGKDAQFDDIYQMKKTVGTLAKIGIEASVALDLVKLIDLTLIKIAFEYQYEKAKTTFYHAPYLGQNTYPYEFSSKEFKVGEELSTSKTVSVDTDFLLWGNSSSTEKQYYHIKSLDTEEKIQQEWWSKESHVNSLFGGIVSSFLGDILGSFLGFSKKFASHQEYSFEENTKDNEFQLEFSRIMYLDNRKSLWSVMKVKLMKSLINSHDLIPQNVKELWNNKWFHKNVYVKDQYSFSSKIFSHFQWLGPYNFQVSSIYLCNLAGHKAVDLNSYEQPIKFNKLKWKQKNCLKNSYDKLIRITQTDNKKQKVERFLDYLKYFLKHSTDNKALYVLFPQELLSQQTVLLAKNKKGESFKGSYTRGSEKSLNLNQEYLNRLYLWR